MDSLKEIAIARIASIIANQEIIKTNSNSTWKEILECAGQKELFKKHENKLKPFDYNEGYKRTFRNENPLFDEFYSGLYNILVSIYSNGSGMDELSELLNVIIDRIKIMDNIKVDDEFQSWYGTVDHYVDKLSDDEYDEFIKDHMTEKIQEFIRCLNILSLEVKFKKNKVVLKPYNGDVSNRINDVNLIEQWLHNNYPECEKSYNDALNNYAEGRYGSCISDCRVTITGIFTRFKETKKWFNGILQLNKNNYMNPDILEKLNKVGDIMKDKSNGNHPRFKAIYNIYRMFCDLGAHRNEGGKNKDEIILENVTIADALMSLRFTEDIIIWAMNTIELK